MRESELIFERADEDSVSLAHGDEGRDEVSFNPLSLDRPPTCAGAHLSSSPRFRSIQPALVVVQYNDGDERQGRDPSEEGDDTSKGVRSA